MSFNTKASLLNILIDVIPDLAIRRVAEFGLIQFTTSNESPVGPIDEQRVLTCRYVLGKNL